MKKILCLGLIAALLCSLGYAQKLNIKADAYPVTAKGTVTDTYFGTVVPDPYRWLEDDRGQETKAWVQEQNKVSTAYFDRIPYRENIRKRLETLWNYEKISAPYKRGRYTYFSKNNGLQSQYVVYRQLNGGAPEVFLDPNTFSKDGTTSLSNLEFSKDGSLAACQVSQGGSDWTKVWVMKAGDKSIVGDTLIDVKFSRLAWKGNEGFYYSSYDRPKAGSQLSGMTQVHKLYYHTLGTPQSSDKLIFGGEQNPRRYIRGYLTDDERYLVISAANSTTGNELYIQDLAKPGSAIKAIVANASNVHNVEYNVGSKLYIHTNLDAPTYKLITVDAAEPAVSNWKDLIPASKDVLHVTTASNKIFAHYLKDATSLVQQYNISGKLERVITLPAIGTASGFSNKNEEKDIYYTFTNYTYPPTIYKYDAATGRSILYNKAGIQFDPKLYESKQVFYRSKDGTSIPMIITYKKGLVLDGKNPTFLYAYGGFGANTTPAFNVSNIILLEQGGIYAAANIRGGGEYGEAWHKAGIKTLKQNVFDDFIAAAEYLVKQKYTSKEFLAISGASNGGLLVGATMTQRPDLCQVAFPAVGVMDMLRYNKFTAGAGWAYDYGTAEDSPEMFKYLYKYSPYHALTQANYPATLVTTADHDDRVVPAHSFKFTARLQEYQKAPAPTVIRIETNAGHGSGRSTAQVIGQETDKWAFMFANMGINYQ